MLGIALCCYSVKKWPISSLETVVTSPDKSLDAWLPLTDLLSQRKIRKVINQYYGNEVEMS